MAGEKFMPITPKALGDHRVQTDMFRSLVPSHADFLKPKKDSPLASGGAAKTEHGLPTYVGAVPPDDVARWGWQKTWDARHKPEK
jgi:hypothetical protein